MKHGGEVSEGILLEYYKLLSKVLVSDKPLKFMVQLLKLGFFWIVYQVSQVPEATHPHQHCTCIVVMEDFTQNALLAYEYLILDNTHLRKIRITHSLRDTFIEYWWDGAK